MSDLSLNVTWQEILRETESGNVPHCRAIAAPLKYHDEIIEALAKIILGSYRPNHPDLLVTGDINKAPTIDLCRNLINEIAVKPLEAQKRLGVIMNSDKLLLPAANSLLKLAEEPPAHACLLFLMEDSRLFLPTLRSRARFNALTFHEENDSAEPPQTAPDWIEWLAKTRKAIPDVDAVIKDLNSWASYAVSTHDFILAERIEKLRLIADRKNLSLIQLCDIIILTLREENIHCENLLDDFR
ncbi:MAG: hypothetical protein IJR35_06585 [Synergistaceae bacterium]|nr:hypothetical protein [Synergistaceae bacterium]